MAGDFTRVLVPEYRGHRDGPPPCGDFSLGATPRRCYTPVDSQKGGTEARNPLFFAPKNPIRATRLGRGYRPMAAPPSLGTCGTRARRRKGEARSDMAPGGARVAPQHGKSITGCSVPPRRRVPALDICIQARRDLRSPQVPLEPQWPPHRAIAADGCPQSRPTRLPGQYGRRETCVIPLLVMIKMAQDRNAFHPSSSPAPRHPSSPSSTPLFASNDPVTSST